MMLRRLILSAAASTLALALPSAGAADQLDWETDEEPRGAFVSFLRDKRDGLLGLLDNALDLQLAVFSEAALLTGSALMLASDAIGLVDDNLVTQYVTRAIASKSLAKTAYLFHVAGSEAILGSHGLEKEWYLESAMAQVNPLLDAQEAGPILPLHPLDFMEDGYFHARPQTARVPGAILLSAVAADGVLRPLGNVALFFDQPGPAEALESVGNGLVRRAVP